MNYIEIIYEYNGKQNVLAKFNDYHIPRIGEHIEIIGHMCIYTVVDIIYRCNEGINNSQFIRIFVE